MREMESAAILSSLAARSPPRPVGDMVGISASVSSDLPSSDPSAQVREISHTPESESVRENGWKETVVYNI